jgi:hypothetical protein
MTALSPSGMPYYFEEESGNRSWQPPSNQPRPPCAGTFTGTSAPSSVAGLPSLTTVRERAIVGSISAKIDEMVVAVRNRGVPLIDPYKLRPWIQQEAGEAPLCSNPLSWPRRLVGSLFYGVLFVPFIFSVCAAPYPGRPSSAPSYVPTGLCSYSSRR